MDEDLSALLVDVPPDGFVPADPDDYQVGPLDLEAAAASEPDREAERSLLVTRGFERGYARAWTRTDDLVMVLVYRFASAEGAEAYLRDGLELALGRGAEPFEVAGVDGAHGFSRVEEAGDGPLVAHAVVYVRGRDFFLVLVASPGPGLGAEDARTLVRRQVGTGTYTPDGE